MNFFRGKTESMHTNAQKCISIQLFAPILYGTISL
nr:MAG TPA: hypothetical protein [Bacteriophage sp.]